MSRERKNQLALLLLAGLLTACSGKNPGSTQSGKDTTGFVEVKSGSGTTIGTIRKLDDFPLYELNYTAAYQNIAALRPQAKTISGAYACTCIAAKDGRGGRILARNFDWYRHPAMVVHTTPKDGFASISVVDISYLG